MDSQDNIQDINQSTKDYLKKRYLAYFILFIVLLVIIAFVLVMTGQAIFITFLIFIFIVVYAVYYNKALIKIRQEFMQEFAASIGFNYAQNGEGVEIKAKFSQVGHDKLVKNVMTGTHSDLPIRIFNYNFIVGEGKYKQTFHYTVFESTFSSSMPDIMLFSPMILSLHQSLDDINRYYEFDTGEYLRLEGDFNKHFSLMVTRNYETVAYEIFTPDIMAILIDKVKNLNFEFVDDKLYIYTGEIINTREEMKNMFDLADYLFDLFGKTLPEINIGSN